jgi:drug/metabolite transporter (DMT)-like permease
MKNYSFPFYLFIPLLSAITYTFAAILFKKELQKGGNLWYINFLSNIGTLIMAIPLFFTQGYENHNEVNLVKPFLTSLIFIAGQTFSLLALKYGDVSVATPLLGTKVIIVALLTVFILNIPVPFLWWIACILTIIAFVLLRGHSDKKNSTFIPTVIYSFLCSLCFAACDIYIQKWAPIFGPDRFISIMFLIIAILSIGFLPFFIKKMPKSSFLSLPLLVGILFVSFQAVAMGFALSRYGNATAINIVFSSRGIWSVIFAFWFGKFLDSNEQFLGKRDFFERLIGSAMILVAIVLVMV